MAESVGTIYYEVEADTAKLVSGGQQVDNVLGKMQSSFSKTDKAANASQFQMTKTASAVQELGRQAQAAQNPLGGLGKVLGGLLTLNAAGRLVQMAEGYNEMSERIRMATASQAEYEEVQGRLLATANATYRSMKEAQEVYILTADALRSMGYSTNQAVDITDSLSFAFVKNATSVQRAESAVSAFTKSTQTGTVAADSWQSIIAAVPTLISDIASASDKTTAAVRKLGAEGKITATMLTEGLRKSLEGNKVAAEGMATTVKDAFTALTNNISAYVGEANQASGATGVMSKAILGLGNNIDTIAKLLGVAGAGAIARYIAQLGVSVVASAKAAVAARSHAAAELERARAQAASTAAAVATAQANAGLVGSHAAAARAAAAHQAATTALAAAQRGAAAAGATVLGLLGGPVGIIGIVASAAAGMYLMSDRTYKAAASLDGMEGSLESAKIKLQELTESQRKMTQSSAEKNLLDSVKELDDAYAALARGVATDGTKQIAAWRAANANAIDELIAKAKAGEIGYKEFDAALTRMVNSYADANGRSKEWVNSMNQQISEASKLVAKSEEARITLKNVAQANAELEGAARGAAAGVNDVNAALGATTDAGQKAIASIQKQIALYGKAGNAASVLYDIEQARQGNGDLSGFSKDELGELEKLAKQLAKLDGAKPGQKYATAAQEAIAYYQGLVSANETAMAKIDAEEKKAFAENSKRLAADPKNRELYAKAALEITKKFANDRATLEEQYIQETAELNIQVMRDAEAKIAAIRDEAIRRANSGVQIGTQTVEQAERDKAAAVDAFEREREKNANQLAKTIADNNIAATESEVQKISMIWQDAIRQADANYQNGAASFAQAEAEKVRAATDAANAMRSLSAQYDPAEGEQQRFQQQMDSSKRLNEAKLIEDQRYRELSAGAERTHQLQMQAIQEQTFAAQSAGNQILIGSLNQLQQVGTSTLTGLLSGATNGTDAMRALAGAVMNEVVGSFVQMGIAQVKAWVMGKTAQAAAAAGYVASVTGQVAATTALAAQAAFASTAAIPIVGPALAPGAAALAGSAAAALGAPAIAGASATLAGGRQYGGPVAPGKMYRINETGAPEVLNMANGQQFMLPNGRGQVVSNKEATSGSGVAAAPRITVNLIEDGSRGGQVDQQQVGDETILNVVVASIRKGEDVAKALEGTYGISRRGR